jgi:hypothetical protein
VALHVAEPALGVGGRHEHVRHRGPRGGSIVAPRRPWGAALAYWPGGGSAGRARRWRRNQSMAPSAASSRAPGSRKSRRCRHAVPILGALQQVVGLVQAVRPRRARRRSRGSGSSPGAAARCRPGRPAAAADQRADHLGLLCQRAHGGGAAGAAGHQADGQLGERRLVAQPLEERIDALPSSGAL